MCPRSQQIQGHAFVENFKGHFLLLFVLSFFFFQSKINILLCWRSRRRYFVGVVNDHADKLTLFQHSQRLRGHTFLANFRENLCENEKFHKTICACSYRAQLESFKPKENGRKSCFTAPFISIVTLFWPTLKYFLGCHILNVFSFPVFIIFCNNALEKFFK